MAATRPFTADALIATADAGEERASVSIVDAYGVELEKIDLGEWGYLHEAVTELRARGWRVYPETAQRRPGTTGEGYLQLPIFRD